MNNGVWCEFGQNKLIPLDARVGHGHTHIFLTPLIELRTVSKRDAAKKNSKSMFVTIAISYLYHIICIRRSNKLLSKMSNN